MAVRISIKSQLNVQTWKEKLNQYWDQQLLQLLEFGFPLDFNRNCPLRQEMGNHKSAVDFPDDFDAYIDEEIKYNAILGLFKNKPIAGGIVRPLCSGLNPILTDAELSELVSWRFCKWEYR